MRKAIRCLATASVTLMSIGTSVPAHAEPSVMVADRVIAGSIHLTPSDGAPDPFALFIASMFGTEGTLFVRICSVLASCNDYIGPIANDEARLDYPGPDGEIHAALPGLGSVDVSLFTQSYGPGTAQCIKPGHRGGFTVTSARVNYGVVYSAAFGPWRADRGGCGAMAETALVVRAVL